MAGPVWECLKVVNLLASEIELQLQFDNRNQLDTEIRSELLKTLTRVKDRLRAKVFGSQNDIAFDLCISGVREVLDKMVEQLNDFESHKIELLRNEIVLVYRVEQYYEIFCASHSHSEHIDNWLTDRAAHTLWKNSLNDSVCNRQKNYFYAN
jgi:poly-gamma-glutamate capsule biosynthesis protein CapA/YwtB (metallophosphatase superfamily)